MAMPLQVNLELPLLKVIYEAGEGGQAAFE